MLQVTFNPADRILLDMADDAENASNYTQWSYGSSCGSPACMLGTYGWKRPESLAAEYLRQHIASAYFALRDELELTEDEFDELFDGSGCGNAGHNGKKAAAYVREFVRLRALARIET